MNITENMEFKIVPENIDNTFETKIISVNDNYITFNANNLLKKDEKFDAYKFSNDGIVFFTATVEEIENGIVKIPTTFNFELLQRRQYARIKVDKNATIREAETNNIFCNAHLLDISVGGFKLVSNQPIEEEKIYILEVNLNNNNLELPFIPINIIEEEDKTFTISASFENIQNTDKIALVQYCYKKQAEDIEE